MRANTLVSVAIMPIGEGDHLSQAVADVVRVIRQSSLTSELHSMGTEIEGPYDEVMALVEEAASVLVDQGIRTYMVIKADIRPGSAHRMTEKIKKVEKLLEDDEQIFFERA